MRIDIGDHTRTIWEEWEDITLKEFTDLYAYFDKHCPADLKDIFFKEDKETTTDQNLSFLEFYIEFLSFILKIDNSILRKVELAGILQIFNHVSKFLFQPKEMDVQESFKFKSKTYVCSIETLKYLDKQIPMRNATFDEYAEASTVVSKFQELEKGILTGLPLLTAIIYRPQSKRWFRKPKIETYDSKKVEARAALFQDLTMDKVWSAYFFLDRQSGILESVSKHYLQGRKANPTSDGRALRSILPKTRSSTLAGSTPFSL